MISSAKTEKVTKQKHNINVGYMRPLFTHSAVCNINHINNPYIPNCMMTHSTYFCRLSCHVYHRGVCLTVFYDFFTAKKGQNNGTLLKNWSQIFTPQGQKRHNTLKSCCLRNTPLPIMRVLTNAEPWNIHRLSADYICKNWSVFNHTEKTFSTNQVYLGYL